jgi:hypothetical protein
MAGVALMGQQPQTTEHGLLNFSGFRVSPFSFLLFEVAHRLLNDERECKVEFYAVS